MVNLIELAGNVLLFTLVFGMSATVDFLSVRSQLGNYRAILCGMICQFFILPLLGFCVVNIFDLNRTVGITMLVLTSSPGGSYSNWWCSMFNADLALSVTMTALSTLLCTIFLPLNLLLYAQWSYDDDILGTLDWESLFTAIAIVLSAIVLGLFCSARIHSHKFNIFANKLGSCSGIILIIFSATMTNNGSADTKIWSRSWDFYLAVGLPCFVGLFLSTLLSSAFNLKKPERVTVSIECCYQNVGVASSVALTMFEGDDLSEALGVPFMYGIFTMTFLAIYCVIAWKAGWTKAPRDAPFFKIIVTNYEVLLAEQMELDGIEGHVYENDNVNNDITTTYLAMDIPLEKKESSGEPKEELPVVVR